MVFSKVDHLSTNLIELANFVKHENCLDLQPAHYRYCSFRNAVSSNCV